jgi:hypothetical protein
MIVFDFNIIPGLRRFFIAYAVELRLLGELLGWDG